ncbi:MAG TPA: signal peptidase II [Vicinamibacterales bacterium]|jgi:signal peptidase II
MRHRNSIRLALLIAVLSTIGCDRVTKHVASSVLADGAVRSYLADTVRLEYVENTGGFLGLGADLPDAWRTTLFTAINGAVLLAIAAASVRFRWRGWLLTGACLVLAGGVSNWVDRAARGTVVDFMNVGVGPLRTGVFNVADVAIMLGLAALALSGFRSSHAELRSDHEPGHPA